MGKQRGFAVTAFLTMTLVIVFALYAGISYDISRSSGLMEDEERTEYMTEVTKALNNYYNTNAWVIDSNANAIDPVVIAQRAGIQLKYGAQLVSSQRLVKNDIGYHIFAFWIPQEGLTGTAFDATTGEFTEGTYAAGSSQRLRYTIVNGATIESELIQSTLGLMETSGTAMEAWFAGRQFQASSLEGSSGPINWFRSPSCTSDSRFITCTSNYEDATIVLSGYGILDSTSLRSAWGRNLLITNDPAIVLNVRPFTMSLRAETPWGRTIDVLIIQPNNNLA